MGTVGGGDKLDFTALGDTVNIAARLGGTAAGGELLISRAAWDRAGLESPADERTVDIVGRTEGLPVVTERVPNASGTPTVHGSTSGS